MRYLLRSLAGVALLLLLAVPVLAQGRVIIRDESGRLDRGQIERAARALVNEGATVAVYFVRQGSEADFLERLNQDGLSSGGSRLVGLLAIYVGLDNRYSSIAFGDGFNEALLVNENYEAIRTGTLNPGLSGGDFTAAVVDTIAAVEEAVANPPVPGGGTEFNLDPTPIVIGGVSVAAVAAGGVALARRRRAQRALNDARVAFEKAKEDAGSAIAQLGQFFRKADERAQFDKVSYTPADVAALAKDQQAAMARFVQVQTVFDDIGEELNRHAKLDIKLYNEGAAQYQQVTAGALEARAVLEAVEARRVELDKLAQQAPGEINSAKKS